MRDWLALKDRVPELTLPPLLQRIADRVYAGRSARQIAEATGMSEERVKLCLAYIYVKLLQLPPPDAAETATVPKSPAPKPGKAGAALRLPELPAGRNLRERLLALRRRRPTSEVDRALFFRSL
jgi:hypothetical protein